MRRNLFILTVWLMLQFQTPCVQGQPVASFSSNATACLSQNLDIQNTSNGANSYAWDFCADDAFQVNAVNIPTTLPGLAGGYSYKLVEDQGNWYGFALSQGNNSLFRLDFGNSPLGIPTVTNLGNPDGAMLFPAGIDVIKSGGLWYGFVGFTNTDFGLVRLDFGNSLANTPAGSNVGMFGMSGRLTDVKLIEFSGHFFLITVNRDNETITRIDFGSSYLNSVSLSDVYQSSPIPGASTSFGLDVIQVGNTWKAMVAGISSNNIVQLDLGPSLSSTFTSIDGAYTFPQFSNPLRVSLIQEGDAFRAFVGNNGSITTVVNLFDMNPVNAPVVIPQPSLPNNIGVDAIRWKGKTLLEGVTVYNSNFNQVIFEQDCQASTPYTVVAQPAGIRYFAQGSKTIELVATDLSGNQSIAASHVSVSSLTSPDIDFSSQYSCVAAPIQFTSINGSGSIATYAWDFGDSQLSSSANPSHQFGAAGSYTTSLTVTGTNTCTNLARRTIDVYHVPSADFTSPATLVCTNQNYMLANTTISDAGSNPTWEWYLNGVLVSTSKDLNTAFSAGNQQVQLVASIPNCTNSKTVLYPAVPVGPVVSFSKTDDCTGNSVLFTNSTTGADAGYQWNFGDGSGSLLPGPSHAYLAPATYQVTLTASNTSGCQNTLTQPIIIYSLPQPDFSIDLPPFSCTNVATPFINTTPPLSDSNITGWDWQFGDGSPNANQKFPAHNYSAAGDYSVMMTATSDAGCTGTVTKVVTISASPVVDFAVGPSCLNQQTKFTDLSSGGVLTRDWQIASTAFTIPNPTYVFTSPGNYPASLTVTSANGCSNVKSVSVAVLTPPALDFSMTNACASQNSDFDDTTPASPDPAVGWNWNFDGNSVTGNPAQFSFPLPGTFNVKMVTTHQSGCKYTLSRNVLINASPVAAFTADPDRGEPPLTVQFNNTSTQADSYLWTFNDKLVSTSTRTSPVYTFTTLGNYSAELTAISNNGCQDKLTLPVQVLTSSIDLVMQEVSLVPDPVTGNLKVAVTIQNNSNVPVNTADVEIQLKGLTAFHEVLTIGLKPGESAYRVLSSSISFSGSDQNFICAEIISEKDVLQDNNKQCIKIDPGAFFFYPYPNPTSGDVHIDWVSSGAGEAVIRIFDSMGKKTFEFTAPSVPGLNQTVIDATALGAGVYVAIIETGTSRYSARFIRQ